MFRKKLEEVVSNRLASFAGGSGYEFEADAKPFKNLSQGPSCQQYTQCRYGNPETLSGRVGIQWSSYFC